MPRRRVSPGDPLRAVGYVRVSTEDQNLGPDAQRSALAAWGARLGVQVSPIHEDHGVSGATPLERRPGLLAALAAVGEHRAGVLVAAKRDRFARDVVIAAAIEHATGLAGATLRTADGSSDATGPEGGMMRGIVDVFAQYEREVIRARTRAALAVKKTRNERVGAVPYGYRLQEDGVHLESDPSEQQVIERARELHRTGCSQRRIATALEELGFTSRAGRRFGKTQIARLLDPRKVA